MIEPSRPLSELELLRDADERALDYTRGITDRRVFPSDEALRDLVRFDEQLPDVGLGDHPTIALLDEVGGPATVASNGPRYFGFVTGATLPVAAAADRLVLAWDQGALMHATSPVAAKVEGVAGRWLLDILDLPRGSGVGFTTSATAGTLIALAAARRALLARRGWDLDAKGLVGSPAITVVASELAHVVVRKALRVLGFGLDNVRWAAVDEFGRVDPDRLPPVDDLTIVVLQAGEVNTGEFDPFDAIADVADRADAWIHVDGAFGLWARASRHRALTEGVDRARSWTVDGHKWLNTPYDSSMVVVRDAGSLAAAMNSDAAYSTASADSQKNLTLEFSRRARGVAVWAVLRSLGRQGVASLVEQTVERAQEIAEGLRDAGYLVRNRVVINQILAQGATAEETRRIVSAAQASGVVWFGPSVWQGEPAFRISVSSWRTGKADAATLVDLLTRLARQ